MEEAYVGGEARSLKMQLNSLKVKDEVRDPSIVRIVVA